MRMGVELLANEPVRLRLGSFFESWLALPTGALRRSLGRDEYHLAITIGPGRRLAATGRTYICQIDAEGAGLGVNQARAAVLTPADLPPSLPVFLGLRTNVFLDLPSLVAGARLRLLRDDQPPVEIPLSPTIAEQVLPGRFLIDLGSWPGEGGSTPPAERPQAPGAGPGPAAEGPPG
ncbi:MAG: hypothetical protein DIU70_007415 [Bacillota bacterium]|nr:MAG: hypothetical protein DIU70_08995 [Bacillota bacterium]